MLWINVVYYTKSNYNNNQKNRSLIITSNKEYLKYSTIIVTPISRIYFRNSFFEGRFLKNS